MRIEVGYGLEGTLTDALSRQIIETVIVPKFKAGAMEQGINEGAQAIIGVLGGDPNAIAAHAAAADVGIWNILIPLLFWVVMVWVIRRARRRGRGGDPGGLRAPDRQARFQAAVFQP